MKTTTTFESIIEIKKGTYITKKDAKEGLYPVILGGKEPAYYIDKFNHTGKAIVISRSGASAGFVSRWDEPIFITDGFLIEPKDSVDYDFVYYALKNCEGILQGRQSGAAIPHITPRLINNIEIIVPSLNEQQKTAGILSAYDDLIENNQKQIKLLEEAAQRLYKEWFVDFRFPGHETAKFINGLPEGWRKGTLSELGQFKRGKTITKEQTVSGSVPVVAGGLEPAYYHNQSNTESPVVTVSASGANAGFTRMYFKKIWASDCSFIDCKLTENLFFMYVFLKENPILLKNLQKGSAQPHVYPTHLNNLLLIIPAKDLLKKFCYVVTPIFSKLGTLDRQISILQEARDRLLPKLMNGEIEV